MALVLDIHKVQADWRCDGHGYVEGIDKISSRNRSKVKMNAVFNSRNARLDDESSRSLGDHILAVTLE